MENKRIKFGFIEMLISTFIWGSVPVFALWCALPSTVFVFFRVVFAAPFVFAYAYKKLGARELFSFKHFFFVIASGIALSMNWIFLFLSFYHTPVANAIVLYYLGPIFTVILAVIFLKEPFNKFLLFLVLFSILGMLAIFLPATSASQHSNILGLLLALLSGTFYGLLGLFSKIGMRYHSSIKLTAYQILVALIFTAPFAMLARFSLNGKVILLLIITGVVHTFFALYLWYDSLNYIKVSTASILAYMDPAFAILLSAIILKQPVTIFQIVGLVFITLSGATSFLNESK
jgi:drug/metabolite transporter (DMT)-like permease